MPEFGHHGNLRNHSRHHFEIVTAADDESFIVYLNDIEVGRADHDHNGWAGMEDVEKLVKEIATGINASLTQRTLEQ